MMKRHRTADEKYMDDTYRLKFLIRYSNIPRNHDESVAEHSFFVAVILMGLHEKYDFDLGWSLKMAVCHDMPEAYTNDISWETKRMFPKVKEALHEAEMELASQFPTPIQLAIQDYLGDSVEAQFVKYADMLQCVQYSRIEIDNGGNSYMHEVYNSAVSRSKELEEELKTYERRPY